MSLRTTIGNFTERIRYKFNNNRLTKGRKYEKSDLDLDLIYNIQPVGNLKAHDKYISMGDSYMACIHLYTAPSTSYNWLFRLCYHTNVVTSIDIETIDKSEAITNLNRSIMEQESRADDARKRSDAKEAISTAQRLDRLLEELQLLGNSLKELHIRLYVYARTYLELEDRIMTIEKKLEEDGFDNYSVNVNEQISEYKSYFLPINAQKKMLVSRPGIPCPSELLAQGLPEHYIGWSDPNGFYLGDTPYSAGNGPVFFNPSHLDSYRQSYDGFICGDKGSGKSTTIKMLIEHNVITGHKVRILDVTGEYKGITKHYGGLVIKPDGETGSDILNPLEILKVEESEGQNYLKHISKMALIYRLKSPKANENEIAVFKDLLSILYEKKGIIDPDKEKDEQQLTGLPPEAYPIYSDLLDLIREQIDINESLAKEKEQAKNKLNYLFNIEIQINDLVKNYGALFNRHTTVKNLMDADIIDFDLSKIATMEPSVFDMQLFNVLSIAYDSCMSVGIEMKNAYDSGKMTLDEVTRHFIYIDECHRTINSNKPYAVERILDMMRQDRKYFISVYLATQNIADMYPTSNATADSLRFVFALCQYKFIFHQDASGAEVCAKAFDEKTLTQNQKKKIPYLEKREMFLNFGRYTIQLQCKLLDRETLAYYGGGA